MGKLSDQTPNAPDNDARKSATKTRRGRPFAIGNPGKPKGARHRTTRAVEALLEGEAEEITRKAIEAAKGGDLTAIRLVLERVAPVARDRTVNFDMPKVEGPGDVPSAVLALMAAVADGDLTPSEASALVGILEGYRKQVETAELAERIKILEEAHARKP